MTKYYDTEQAKHDRESETLICRATTEFSLAIQPERHNQAWEPDRNLIIQQMHIIIAQAHAVIARHDGVAAVFGSETFPYSGQHTAEVMQTINDVYGIKYPASGPYGGSYGR